MIFWFMENQQR